MKNTYLSLGIAACALAACFPLNAARLSPEQSLQRALPVAKAHKVVSTRSADYKLAAKFKQLYVFSSPTNYLVTSADDEVEALLGYGGDSSYAENPNLQYWLSFYDDEIDAALRNGVMKSDAVRPTRNPISPLLQTLWNQEWPYYNMCPTLNGKQCVTGCVATAMAQVMKYHAYPTKGIGSHSYTWSEGEETLSFDFGDTTFEWNQMADTYNQQTSTQAQIDAVATLMKACGVSVDMSYDPSDSGAMTRTMGTSLITYFGYDKGLWMPERDYYDLIDWENMIYADLAAGLPVLYSGVGSAGGHQFVCDGYDKDGYFHFNWGWGGLSDGYFLLTALDPPALGVGGGAGGFNYEQSVALGVKPAAGSSDYKVVVYCQGGFNCLQQSTQQGSGASFGSNFFNYGFEEIPSGYIGIKITASNGTATYSQGYSIAGMPAEQGYTSFAVGMPVLPDGTYKITPAYKLNGEWYDIPVAINANPSVTADFANGMITYSTPDAPSISVSDLKLNSPLYNGSEFYLNFTVTNNGEEEYMGSLSPALFASESSATPTAMAFPDPVDIASKDTRTEDYYGTFQPAVEGQESISNGDYYLGIIDASSGRLMSALIPVTLKAAPSQTSLSVSGLEIVGQDPENVSDKYNVEFSMKVSCTAGYWPGPLTVAVFPSYGGQELTGGTTEKLFLSAGDSKTATATLDLSELSKGTYIAAVYGNSQLTTPYSFVLVDEKVGVDMISLTNESKIYDLNGREVNIPLNPGIYIVDGKKIVVDSPF